MEKTRWNHIFTLLLLCLIGMGITYSFSASSIFALDAYDDMYYFLKKQIFNFTLGVVALLVVANFNYKKMRKLIPLINLATIILMFLPLIPQFAVSVNGAERWVNLFGLSFQPSEIAKITIIITVAHMIDVRNRMGVLNNFTKGILPILSYLVIFAGILIFVQKHLSATGLVILVTLAMLIVGGLAKKYYFILGLSGLGLAVFAVMLEPFRLKRIFGFLNPEDDPTGSGYHIMQSFYAVASGEFFGAGLGMSKQKFTWLPENHTDFIMGVIGEEGGFIGVLIIVVLFVLFIISGFLIASECDDVFATLIGVGVMSLIAIQSALNMMVVSGMFPVTGIPLPFISYGGTSTIILMMNMGLIYNISKYGKNKKTEK